jgi:hypothetical protein
MGKKLARYVNVDGATYGPDDDVPADIAEQITNPKAWEADEDVSDGDPAEQDRFVGDVSSDSPPKAEEVSSVTDQVGEDEGSTATRRRAAKKTAASS